MLLLVMFLAGNMSYAIETASVHGPLYPWEVALPAGSVRIHMPQVDSWEWLETIAAWSTIEVTLKSSAETWLGTIKVKANRETNFDERLDSEERCFAATRHIHSALWCKQKKLKYDRSKRR